MNDPKGNIKTKIDFSSDSFKKYFVNTSWLFFERFLRMGISFVVSIFVVRYLGPKDFGLFSYVLSFFWLFASLSTLGLESITTREIVKHPDKKDVINGTVFYLRIAGSICGIFLIGITLLLTGEDTITAALIMIVSGSFLFQSFSVIEYYFRGIVQAKYNAYALSASVILASVFKIILILLKAPLIYFVYAVVFEYAVLAVGLVGVYHLNKFSVFSWKYSKSIASSLLKDSWPLALSGVVVMIYVRIDQIMIKNMISVEAVGYYSAAVRLCEAWYFIPVTLCNSIFPAIVNAKNVSLEFYNNRMQKLYDLLTWLAIGIAVPVTIFSEQIIQLLFGSEFSSASPVLTIYIWAGVAVFLGVASSQYLINENLTKLSFFRTLIGMILNVVLNMIFIPRYGIIGSAFATLISYSAVLFVPLYNRYYHAQLRMMLRSVTAINFINYCKSINDCSMSESSSYKIYQQFKLFIYKRLIPLIRLWKNLNWFVYLKTHHDIKIIVGAGPTNYKGWFSTDIVTLDITNENHFKKYFTKKKIYRILAEHVLEHLSEKDLKLMLSNFFKYSSDDVNIRIAVPDGFHKDADYINKVKPGGTGEGADNHRNLFNYKALSKLFEENNFSAKPVEYWDENGSFHQGYINDEDGFIKRSFINDSRNSDGIPHYTSLIIDFRKS